MKGTMEMTGIEFRNKVEEFRTNKDITVAKHEEMFSELRGVALKTIKKFLVKYGNYLCKKYDVDIDSYNIYIVSISVIMG